MELYGELFFYRLHTFLDRFWRRRLKKPGRVNNIDIRRVGITYLVYIYRAGFRGGSGARAPGPLQNLINEGLSQNKYINYLVVNFVANVF